MEKTSRMVNLKGWQRFIIKAIVFIAMLILFNQLELNPYLGALLALIVASVVPNIGSLKEIQIQKGKAVVKSSKYQSFFKVAFILAVMSFLVTDLLRYYFLAFAFINLSLAFWVKKAAKMENKEESLDKN